jgi:hypothetical protein
MSQQEICKMTSRLNHILSVLRANPKVAIIRADGSNAQAKNSLSQGSIEIWAAPKQGLYNLWELNPFLEQLVPGIAPASTTLFAAHRNRLYFGSLFFWEDLDEDRPSSPADPGKGGIRLRLYPTRKIAEGILEGRLRDRDDIAAGTLLSYGQG